MNNAMSWTDEVRGNDSLREMARRARVHQATLNRQINLDQLTFEMVREISRAYGRPVLADLITTGHLAASDAGIGDIETALHAATDSQLVLEIARRLDATDIGTIYDQPISAAVETATPAASGTDVAPSREDVALAALDDEDWQRRQEEENE